MAVRRRDPAETLEPSAAVPPPEDRGWIDEPDLDVVLPSRGVKVGTARLVKVRKARGPNPDPTR